MKENDLLQQQQQQSERETIAVTGRRETSISHAGVVEQYTRTTVFTVITF